MAECARAGVLRNTSVMVPGPAFDYAAQVLADIPGLCVGLHVTLNSEWSDVRWGPVLPADQVPSLVDERGLFTRAPHVLHERGGLDIEQATREAKAQLDRMRQAGLEPAYMDEHMGVGWLPGLRDALLELARREGLIPAERFSYLRRPPATESASPTVRSPSEELLWRLRWAEPGTYVHINHTSLLSDETLPPEHLAERDGDRLLWTDPTLPGRLAELQVACVRYVDVA